MEEEEISVDKLKTYYNNVLASNLQYLLNENHMTRVYLGRITGVSASTIDRILSGYGTTVQTVGLLSRGLNCNSGDLIDNWREL